MNRRTMSSLRGEAGQHVDHCMDKRIDDAQQQTPQIIIKSMREDNPTIKGATQGAAASQLQTAEEQEEHLFVLMIYFYSF